MELTIIINLENSAYEGEGQNIEIKNNLLSIVEKLENGKREGMIFDSNGNHVGYFKIDNY